MISHITYSSIQKSLIVGIMLCLFVMAYSLLRYPAIFAPLRTGMFFASIFFIVLLSYGIVVWRLFRNTTVDAIWSARSGLGWGILVSVFWLAEIVTGNLADSGKTWVRLIYFGSSTLALILPLIGGIWGTKHSGYIRTGTLVGLYSGLVSGLLTFLILMAVTYLFLNTFLQDTQNILQFQESGAPDFTSFVIGDSLAGGIGHLVIGLVLGTGLGAVGGVIGKIVAHGSDKLEAIN